MGFVDQLSQWIIEKSITTLIIVPTLGCIGWYVLRYVVRLLLQAWLFLQSRQHALDAVGREGTNEGKGVWLTKPVDPPRNYWHGVTNSKTLAIANLKGGVGKTTLAANIAAYLAKDWQKRVLLIDLDFQGSLSSMAFPGKVWLPAERQSSPATRLISGDIVPTNLHLYTQNVNLNTDEKHPGRLDVVTAYYDLAQADNRTMVEWLLQCITNQIEGPRHTLVGLPQPLRAPDVRYTLAKVLHAESVQRTFDLIIIDCPPRLTTSEIQAFCASSHLLIPTILDRTSAEAVVSFRDQVETLKRADICPHLKYMGVVGTMWRPDRNAQRDALTFLKDALKNGPLGILDEEKFVRHSAALVNDASDGIAHIVMPNNQDGREARRAIAELSGYVAAKIGISRDSYFHEAAE